MEFIETLNGINHHIETWLDRTTATTPEAEAARQRVLALQQEIYGQLAELRLADLQAKAAQIRPHTTRLAAITTQIESTVDKLRTAEEVIAGVTRAVAIAAQVIALVVGA